MQNTYLKAACLGIIAGMRSMAAPALVSDHFAHTSSELLAQSPLRLFGSPAAALILKGLASGEVVADKLPGIPNRIDPGPLAARAVSGGLCGAAVCTAEEQSAALGASIGAAAAILSAFGFYHLRQQLGKKLKVPDPWLAATEDAIAVGIARSIF